MNRRSILLALLLVASFACGIFYYGLKTGRNQAIVVNEIKSTQAVKEAPVEYRGQLDYAQGQVEKRLGEDDGWKSSVKGDVFTGGMEVRTLVDSKAVLTFEDGSVARLDQNTQIKILTEGGNITLEMPSGAVFNRVAKNASRQYAINTGDYSMRALGTVFSVSNIGGNNAELMVMDSQVEVKKENGEALDTVQTGEKISMAGNKNEKKKIDKADLEKSFIAWGMKEDSVKDPLAQEKKEGEKKEEEKKAADESPKISLTAKTVSEGVKLSWSLEGVSGFEGFKVVKSEKANPSYPGSPYNYLSGTGERSFVWKIEDHDTYHFRVCAYAEGKCKLYSNDVTAKSGGEGETAASGSGLSLSATKDGDSAKLTWSLSKGSAPLGFKVVSSKNKNPEYPTRSGDSYQYLSDSDVRKYTWEGFSSGKTYHFRVCVYKGGSCGAYSNDVEVSF